MNFNKITFLLLTVCLILTSCSKSKQLSDAIPANANYVLYVNTKSLVEKSNYDLFENPTVKQGLNFYKVMLKDDNKIKLLDDFLKNSNSLGLNLKDEFYIYTDYKVYGFVIGVNDAAKLQSSLLDLQIAKDGDIKKEGDVYSLSPDSKISIVWDNSKLIALADISSVYGLSDSSPINVAELSLSQLKQGSDKSINSNKSYAEFFKTRKDISLFYSMKGMADVPAFAQLSGAGMGDMLTSIKTIFTELDGVSLGYNTSFEKGEIVMSTKYYFNTPEDETKLKEYVATISGSLNGDNLKYITSDPLFMASVNLKGDGVYKYLNEFGVISKMKREISDSVANEKLDDLLKNVNGDITFALTSVENQTLNIMEESADLDESFDEQITKTIPQCVLFVDMKDAASCLAFIKDLVLKEENSKVKELTSNSFLYSESGINIYFGVNNNSFYVTNIQSVYDNLTSTNLKNNYTDLIKDKYALILGDIQKIKPYLEGEPRMLMLLPFINELSKYSMTVSSTDFSGEGKVEFTNKEKNSLAVICEQVDKLISNLASSMGGF